MIASPYMRLPAAPATEVSASISGTPAARVVGKVGAKRRITERNYIFPEICIFSIYLSMTYAQLSDRRSASLTRNSIPAIHNNLFNLRCRATSDRCIIYNVKADSSEPKLLKVDTKHRTPF